MANARPADLWNPKTYDAARTAATSDASCSCGAQVPEMQAQQQYDRAMRIHCGFCDIYTAVPDF